MTEDQPGGIEPIYLMLEDIAWGRDLGGGRCSLVA